VGENLAYALTQLVHNFGAVAVLGGPLFALWPTPRFDHARRLARVIVVGWALQIASGINFGVTSYYYYGETPDLSGIAITALAVKVVAAISGFLLASVYLARGVAWTDASVARGFQILAALGAIALTGAAFLRWFS
jgi:hypothetical protein